MVIVGYMVDKVVKVIIEMVLLMDGEIVKVSEIVVDVYVDFVKILIGFLICGVLVYDISLMKGVV